MSTNRSRDLCSLEESLARDGYCTLHAVLTEEQVTNTCLDLDVVLSTDDSGILRSHDQAYGVRNLLQLWPAVVDQVRIPMIRELVHDVMGEQVGIVRALLFDKPPGRSWTLPWHRDRTIAVRHIPTELNEFSHPTCKAGIPHVTAPNWLLSNMLTLRFSLDPMQIENGPLVVVPGSHNVTQDCDGDLGEKRKESITTILCDAGDLFVMRPLLAHSSMKSTESTQLRRRVVHVELCNQRELPEGLEWHEFQEL